MKKLILYILLSLFLLSDTVAQNVLPPVYEIKTDTAFQQDLNNSYWQILEDREGQWTIRQVSTLPISAKFLDSTAISKSIDTTIHTYWFRYRLKNNLDHDAKIALDARSGQDDFYIEKPDGSRDHFVTGYLYPWNKRDGFKMGNYIPLVIQPGEEIMVYQRSYDHEAGMRGRLPVDFVNSQRELEREFYKSYNIEKDEYFSMNEILEAFILGFLFISIFFNLFFYSIVREKVYLYFPLFLFFLGINRLYNISHFYTKWVLPSMNKYVEYLGYAWLFILFFLVQFVRHYFKTFRKYPKWDKFLLGLAILEILINLLDIVFPSKPQALTPFMAIVLFFTVSAIPFFLFITLLFFISKPDRFQRLVIAGAAPLTFFYGTFGVLSTWKQLGPPGVFPGLLAWAIVNFRIIEITCIIWLILLFSLVLFLRYNQLRKENARQALEKEKLEREKEIERNQLIAQQKIDLERQVAERTAELKHSIEELKSTQAQLVQSEKMASLGELTAGIAHEIQNPLNFVNNFAEVNKELLMEMKDEIEKGNLEEVKAIANDVIDNQEKINHHGKRADAIVKGMLQHSRSSSGVKEPTDINALADEYLRLAYHGLRARDKSFNATMKTGYDESAGKINIVPQDIGRAVLNLITNAFYAVAEKKKQQPDGYEPVVAVTTKKILDKIEIKVRDNGNGIPQMVIDKIFQPFFTTKPTGQGTGLGLSLSYDIIKAHNGELKVITPAPGQNDGAEFIIILPAAEKL